MKNYELVYVVKPNSDDETREAVLDSIKNIITEAKGEVGEIDVWGSRKLAYPIEKFRDGVYTLVNFKADVEFPKELDRRLKISEDVIRHVIVAQEEN